MFIPITLKSNIVMHRLFKVQHLTKYINMECILNVDTNQNCYCYLKVMYIMYISWLGFILLKYNSEVGMDLATYFCVICGVENGINWWQLAVFSFDRGLACHFMAPNPLHPYRSACGISYASKQLAGNSATYPFNSWSIDRLWIATELWQIACKHLFSFPRYNTSNT